MVFSALSTKIVISQIAESICESVTGETGGESIITRSYFSDKTFKTFSNLSDGLNKELKSVTDNYFAVVDRNDDANDYWFKRQIVDVAKFYDYYADTRTYRSWIRLKIKEERQAELIVSFHSLGVEFLGIIVASAFIIYRDISSDNEVAVDGPHITSKSIFQFAYNESKDEINKRFDIWVKDVVLFGIDEWRRQL